MTTKTRLGRTIGGVELRAKRKGDVLQLQRSDGTPIREWDFPSEGAANRAQTALVNALDRLGRQVDNAQAHIASNPAAPGKALRDRGTPGWVARLLAAQRADDGRQILLEGPLDELLPVVTRGGTPRGPSSKGIGKDTGTGQESSEGLSDASTDDNVPPSEQESEMGATESLGGRGIAATQAGQAVQGFFDWLADVLPGGTA